MKGREIHAESAVSRSSEIFVANSRLSHRKNDEGSEQQRAQNGICGVEHSRATRSSQQLVARDALRGAH
ncbi:hypothetical protein PF008_g33535, partial [Phytophthora fragariae]